MKKRVLIVDDDIMTLKILKNYLENEFDIVTENAGYRFVEKMESYGADLILLDVEMPVVNGIQAFDAIINNPRMKNVPVAFLSGITNPNFVREVLQKGAAGYIVKATPNEELIAKINHILEKNVPREVVAEIMILHSDSAVLKPMRETLTEAGYKVKLVKNMLEAIEYMRSKHPNIFIIGSDSACESPQEIYDSLSHVMHEERVVGILMEKPFFSQELLDKVRENLGE